LANILAEETRVFDVIAPWLTLDGLKIVWELNRK
jgi:type III pantothenate kinase